MKHFNDKIIALLLVCGALIVAMFILAGEWQAGYKELSKPIMSMFGFTTVLIVFILIIDELRGKK